MTLNVDGQATRALHPLDPLHSAARAMCIARCWADRFATST